MVMAERLLRESLSLFVDARPPADFVVYPETDQGEPAAEDRELASAIWRE